MPASGSVESPDSKKDDSPMDNASRKPKVIAPISDPAGAGPDLNQLLAAEMAKEQGATITPSPAPTPSAAETPTSTPEPPATPPPAPTPSADTVKDEAAIQSMLSGAQPAAEADEKKIVSDQIQDFVNTEPADDKPAAPAS
jgi:hypothetical protein